jgi:RPA family protein
MTEVPARDAEFRQRSTAVKCMIGDLLSGDFVRGEGFDASYVQTKRGIVSRANIIAVVISNDAEGMMIDDGSGRMQLRGFDNQNMFADKQVGDIVLVIGKPRMYSSMLYLYPEIIKKTDRRWIEFRRKELSVNGTVLATMPNFDRSDKAEAKSFTVQEQDRQEKAPMQQQLQTTEKKLLDEHSVVSTAPNTIPSSKDSIVSLIKKLDKGEGVDVADLVRILQDDHLEQKITNLIKVGELFEIRRGKLKILE